jgi:hypothetical protein
MLKTKLVKRQELVEREKAKHALATSARSLDAASQTIKAWASGRQPRRGINPREAFAALFAQPQTG